MKNTYKANVTPFEKDGTAIKALATITVNDSIAVSGIKLTEGKNGLSVQFPGYKDKNGDFQNIAFPVTAEDRKAIIEAVISQYERRSAEKPANPTEQENAANAEKTDIKVRTYLPKESQEFNDQLRSTRGYATVMINDSFMIKGVKVTEGKNGLFVQMPNYRKNNGEYADIAFPITKQMREKLNAAVMESYQLSKMDKMDKTNSVYKNVTYEEAKKLKSSGIQVSFRQSGDEIVAKFFKYDLPKVNELLKTEKKQTTVPQR